MKWRFDFGGGWIQVLGIFIESARTKILTLRGLWEVYWMESFIFSR